MSKPKAKRLLFVYDNPIEPLDGLHAAIDLLREDFEIHKLNLRRDQDTIESYDFCLGHGAFNSAVDKYVRFSRAKMTGLCIGGNSFPPTNAEDYDLLACETDWIKDVYLRGVQTKMVKAFGVNTDLFSPPQLATTIVWDYIGVGSFSTWKRWEKMIDKPGTKLVIGEYQLGNEKESLGIVQRLIRGGVMVGNMVSPYDLVNLYYSARTACVFADISGGGERSVLEARACGLQVEIEDDNPKLRELLDAPVPTHHDYADALKKGIFSVL